MQEAEKQRPCLTGRLFWERHGKANINHEFLGPGVVLGCPEMTKTGEMPHGSQAMERANGTD